MPRAAASAVGDVAPAWPIRSKASRSVRFEPEVLWGVLVEPVLDVGQRTQFGDHPCDLIVVVRLGGDPG